MPVRLLIAIVIACLILFAGLAIAFRGFGVVNANSVASDWRVEYEVSPDNFDELGVPGITTTADLMHISERLQIDLGGLYTQTIQLLETGQTITGAGRWEISDRQGEPLIYLYSMKYLAPYVDLKSMARFFRKTDPSFGRGGYEVFEPDRFLFYDRWLDDTPSSYYFYPDGGYVLLYPRRTVRSGENVLAHGTIGDVGVVEYHRVSP